MKNHLLGVFAALVAFTLIACANLNTPIPGAIADTVDRYCQEPRETRHAFRAEIDRETSKDGHQVRVDCASDRVASEPKRE